MCEKSNREEGSSSKQSLQLQRRQLRSSNWSKNLKYPDIKLLRLLLQQSSDLVSLVHRELIPVQIANHQTQNQNTNPSSICRSSDEEQTGRPKTRSEKSTASAKKKRQEKAREAHREALHNTRDTITLVAILIATFTYNAGIIPPGGVYQDGPLIGTAVAARKTAFRVFSVCNNVALFTSICIVLVLVSIIPFKRKAVMRLLSVAHKAIWVAVSFLATAYVAAVVVVMQPPPRRKGLDWTTVFLLSICSGSLGTVFVGLVIVWVKHRLMKRKWREQHPRRRRRSRQQSRKRVMEEYLQQQTENVAAQSFVPVEESAREKRENYSDDDEDEDSDMASERERGYHTY